MNYKLVALVALVALLAVPAVAPGGGNSNANANAGGTPAPPAPSNLNEPFCDVSVCSGKSNNCDWHAGQPGAGCGSLFGAVNSQTPVQLAVGVTKTVSKSGPFIPPTGCPSTDSSNSVLCVNTKEQNFALTSSYNLPCTVTFEGDAASTFFVLAPQGDDVAVGEYVKCLNETTTPPGAASLTDDHQLLVNSGYYCSHCVEKLLEAMDMPYGSVFRTDKKIVKAQSPAMRARSYTQHASVRHAEHGYEVPLERPDGSRGHTQSYVDTVRAHLRRTGRSEAHVDEYEQIVTVRKSGSSAKASGTVPVVTSSGAANSGAAISSASTGQSQDQSTSQDQSAEELFKAALTGSTMNLTIMTEMSAVFSTADASGGTAYDFAEIDYSVDFGVCRSSTVTFCVVGLAVNSFVGMSDLKLFDVPACTSASGAAQGRHTYSTKAFTLFNYDGVQTSGSCQSGSEMNCPPYNNDHYVHLAYACQGDDFVLVGPELVGSPSIEFKATLRALGSFNRADYATEAEWLA